MENASIFVLELASMLTVEDSVLLPGGDAAGGLMASPVPLDGAVGNGASGIFSNSRLILGACLLGL